MELLSKNSCAEAGHRHTKELFYTTKKCSLCKKRCLFRAKKMVKCIACKCVMHKRCLAVWIEQRPGSDVQVKQSVVVPQDAEVLQPVVESAPSSVDDKDGVAFEFAAETFGTPITVDGHPVPADVLRPVVALSAPAAPVVVISRRPPSLQIQCVPSGHDQLLRLRMTDNFARAFGQNAERAISTAVVRRPPAAQLLLVACRIVAPAAVTPTINPAAPVDTMACRPSHLQVVSTVDDGHDQLLRLWLRMMDNVARAFDPTVERVITAAVVLRPGFAAQLVVTFRIVTAAVTLADKLAIAPTVAPAISPVVIPPASRVVAMAACRRPTSSARSVPAVSSGRDQQLQRLRMMEIVGRAFGPAIERVISVAIARHPRLAQLVVAPSDVIPAIAPAITAPPPQVPEQITAFDCLKLVWASLSGEQKELRAKAQRLKIAPAPFVIESRLTAQDYAELSKEWTYGRIRPNENKRVIQPRIIFNSNFVQPDEA